MAHSQQAQLARYQLDLEQCREENAKLVDKVEDLAADAQQKRDDYERIAEQLGSSRRLSRIRRWWKLPRMERIAVPHLCTVCSVPASSGTKLL